MFLYGLDGLGYVVSRFHSGPGDFQGLGLTSDETFTLRVEWRLANGGPGGDLCFWEDRVITVRDLDRPPVLALRGTEPAKIQDLFTDFDPSGVGWGQFNASRFLMERWLDEFRSPEESLQVKPHITGHSLGGALAQWIAAYYTQSLFEGSLGDIVTFNTPGISRDGASRFDRFRAEAVTHYITSADLASLAGEAFLPPTDKQSNLQNHNPAWVKASYLSTYESILGADRADFKHSAPVIAPIVYGDPPRVNQVDSAVPFPTVDDLSGDLFSYSFPEQLVPPQQPDPDYFAFQLWVAETLAPYVTTPVGALIAAQLSFRASVELNRQQIGTLLFDPGINFLQSPRIDFIQQKLRLLGPTAWAAIYIMTRNKVAPNQQFQKLPDGILPIQPTRRRALERAQRQAQAPKPTVAHDFWEAATQWPEAAWQVMDQWPDYAWEAMESWGTGQWTATLAEDFPWSQTPNWTPEHWNLEPIPGRVVRGIVWDDSLDGDGLYDFPFESTLVGRNVYLDVNGNQAMDAGDLISVTNAQGEYELYAPTLNGVPSLLDGSYTVTQLSNDPGWQITSPAGGSYVVLFDQPVQVYDGFDFGNQCVNNCLDEDDTIVLNEHAFIKTFTGFYPATKGPTLPAAACRTTPESLSVNTAAVS